MELFEIKTSIQTPDTNSNKNKKRKKWKKQPKHTNSIKKRTLASDRRFTIKKMGRRKLS